MNNLTIYRKKILGNLTKEEWMIKREKATYLYEETATNYFSSYQ